MSEQSKLFKRTHAILASVLCSSVLFAGPVLGQNLELSATGQKLDGIAALVNDGVVLISELQEQTAMITARLREEGTQLPPEDILAQQILESLIVNRIQLQRARREGITVPDEMLNRALSDIARRNGTTLGQLPELLAQDGMDYAVYRKEMREQLTMERLRQRDVVSRIAVNSRELEDYLERESTNAYRNQRYNISHILISMPASSSPEGQREIEARVWELFEKLQGGADFAQMAVAYSNAQSALDGGSMGWRDGDALPSLFAQTVPNMQKGDISEPIRSPSGFHIIKLDDVEGNEPIMENQIHARHILIETDEIMDDDIVRQELIDIRQGILDGDDFAAIAKAVSKDPGSAIEGGDLGWAGPGLYVGKFQEVLDSLEIGEISEPFKTPFGWHIAEVLERRVHDTTDDVMRQRATMAIRDSKVAEETELWLRQMRDESFVEYRL